MTALTAGWNRAVRGGTGIAKPRRRPGISAIEAEAYSDAMVNNRPIVPPGCLMVEQRDSAACAA